MRPAALCTALSGVIGFCPTPFNDMDLVDHDALAQQIDRLCTSGVGSIVVCGGVGEFYALDEHEHREIVRVSVAAARARVPVIAGVGHNTRVASRLAEAAATNGADGLMVNPLYFTEATTAGLRRHYETIGRASNLGCVVYHTGVWPYDLAMLRELAEVDAVVGVKDEVGDLDWFSSARMEIGDRFAWINGTGEMLAGPYAAAGAVSMTSGLVNFVPWLTLEVWRAASECRYKELEAMIDLVRPVAELRRRRAGYSTVVVKEAMHMRGFATPDVRLPLLRLESSEREELRWAIKRIDEARDGLRAPRSGPASSGSTTVG